MWQHGCDRLTVNATGVREEFELAEQKGLYVVPVGSQVQWRGALGEVDEEFEKHFL